jgi:hypothetical protein
MEVKKGVQRSGAPQDDAYFGSQPNFLGRGAKRGDIFPVQSYLPPKNISFPSRAICGVLWYCLQYRLQWRYRN